MSGISSGIGLISGIDTASLIEQLMAIERRPVDNLRARLDTLDVQRAAFLDLSAQLMGIQNSLTGFGQLSFFHRFSAASSNDAVLRATASSTASPGTHTFRVRSLVSNHAVISRGFADADRTQVGVGTITLESARGRVDLGTPLEMLNGGAGVRRGVISITDRSGATSAIDLTTALTVDDVLDAINNDAAINVRAYVTGLPSGGASGDRIVIEDRSAQEEVAGNLVIADVGGGFMASDLGITGNATAARIDGHDLIRLTEQTPLSLLNDGNGVDRFASGTDLKISTTLGDFDVSLTGLLVHQLNTDLKALNSGNGVRLGTVRITDRSGQSAEIDLSAAQTVQDVLNAINAADVSVRATVIAVNDRSVFQITDTSEAPSGAEESPKLIIEDVTGSTAADLGIAQTVDGTSIQGSSVYQMRTIGDVLRAINFAPGNDGWVEASLSSDGKGISLTALGDGNSVTVAAGEHENGRISGAARDLGLLGAEGATEHQSRRLIGGLNSVLLSTLNGGQGVQTGQVRLTDRTGHTTTIDFSAAVTLQDVIDLINGQTESSLHASVNTAGNGVALRDDSGGNRPVVLEDVTGSLAADLGLAGTFSLGEDQSVDSGSLQRQYVSRSTSLAGLNGGRGVGEGSFTITDASGAVYTVNLGATARTVGDAIDAINAATPDTIQAAINETGDGILITDDSEGTSTVTIADVDNGRTAAALRLAGIARTGENRIDGSFEVHIPVNAADTLTSIAQKVNDSGADVSASIVNYGGTVNPFSLTLTSNVSGSIGELLVDTRGFDLGFATLTQARDAVITLGDESGSGTRLIASTTNTVDDVIPGVTLNLLAVGTEPVTVSVGQNVDGIVEAINNFVTKYNKALDTIDDKTRFNPDTLERGPLLGDRTVDLIRTRLVRLPLRHFADADESVARLFGIGLRLGDGNRLEFDEDRFRKVYEESPEAVEQLFTQEDTGLAAVFTSALEELTRDFDGVISRKEDLLADQKELLNDRIDSLNGLLEAKRSRLEAEFVALESSLASLQSQQNALAALAQLVST